MGKQIKVLLAKLGLDVHNRGVLTVAMELRDVGMEVVYIGNALHEEIVTTAIQEGVDVVGVSSLGGAHLSLGKQLLKEAERKRIKRDTIFVIGGVFGPADVEELKKIGFNAVFPPGSTKENIVRTIKEKLRSVKCFV